MKKRNQGFINVWLMGVLALAVIASVIMLLKSKNISSTPATGNSQTVSNDNTVNNESTVQNSSETMAKETQTAVSVTKHIETIDKQAIPLGDGKVSASPKVGYVYSCQQSFNGGGAEHAGNWISGSTWDLTKKISVLGSVSWPSANFSASLSGTKLILSGNGLPVDAKTGIFPINSSDPAYQYDRNPNSIESKSVYYQISADPAFANSPSCVPMGAIGYALNGVAIYNALDASGRDAVAHEVQDSCDGHPQGAGEYHYHGPSTCMPHANENNAQVGYALDGFGIYSMYNADGKEYTDADLDTCHGTTSEIIWHGKTVNMYHYVLTREYPYTIGCFKGTPVKSTSGQAGQQNEQKPSGAPTPPQAAIDACTGKTTGSYCSFSGGQGSISGSCQTPPGQKLACVPN